MSARKEDFLKIQTYEEFDKRREEFRGMEWDEELSAHFHTFFYHGKGIRDGIIIEAFPPGYEES